VNDHSRCHQVNALGEEGKEWRRSEQRVPDDDEEVSGEERLQRGDLACVQCPAPERGEEGVGGAIQHQEAARGHCAQLEGLLQEGLKVIMSVTQRNLLKGIEGIESYNLESRSLHGFKVQIVIPGRNRVPPQVYYFY
jgi:hypothetical protein